MRLEFLIAPVQLEVSESGLDPELAPQQESERRLVLVLELSAGKGKVESQDGRPDPALVPAASRREPKPLQLLAFQGATRVVRVSRMAEEIGVVPGLEKIFEVGLSVRNPPHSVIRVGEPRRGAIPARVERRSEGR